MLIVIYSLRQNECIDCPRVVEAILRPVESVKDLVIFNVKTFINSMVRKIVPPDFFAKSICGCTTLKMVCKNFKRRSPHDTSLKKYLFALKEAYRVYI